MATTTKTARSPRKSTPAGRKPRRAVTAPEPEADAPVAVEAAPVVAPDPTPVAEDAAADLTFRRPDLIQAVAERSALKRSDCKLVLELVLEELGKALDARDELALPPLGKLSIKKRKTLGAGEMLTVKLKRPSPSASAAPDAEPEDD